MNELAPIIRDLTVILSVAGIVTLLFQKIHQPVVLGYLVAGIIVGPYTPPYAFVIDIPDIKVIAELGVIFLMFSLGLEFSFHKLTKVGFSASFTGLIEVILMLMIGYATGMMIGWSHYDSVFLGAALAISSTTIIIKALEELSLTKKRFAQVVFGILVMEDLLAILILVALSTLLMTKNVFSMAMIMVALKLVIVVMSWFLIGYFLVPNLFRRMINFSNSETLTIVSIALCLFLVAVAAYFHYSTALGAFIMGSILAETPQVPRIQELIKPIRDIFAAVFFVSVGMLIDPKIIIMHWQIVLLISTITILGKILTSCLGSFLTGQNLNSSLRIGFSMAQIGEFSFIIVGSGVVLGVVNNELYAIVVAVSAITTFTTPYLIRTSGYLGKKFEASLSVKTRYFLENYSAWIEKLMQSSVQQKQSQQAILRFIINSIVLVIIFTLVEDLLFPQIQIYIPSSMINKIVSWSVSFILASPFIWAMLFSFDFNQENKKIYLISPLVIFAWILTIGEVSYLSLSYYQDWKLNSIYFMIALLIIILFFQLLKKSYYWFEQRILSNIQR